MLVPSHELDYCLDQSLYVWPSSSACFSASAFCEQSKRHCKDGKPERAGGAEGLLFLTGLLAPRLGSFALHSVCVALMR